MLFRPNIYDSFMNGDFTDYLILCKKNKILPIIEKIYRQSLKNDDYDETKLFDYLTHDCQLMIRLLKGEQNLMEKYYVDRDRWSNGVEWYLKNIDLLDFFINNTKE